MIRLARELLRIALQLALLPLVWLFGAGAIATIVLAPIHFFKFGTGTGAEWDGFNVLVLADWKLKPAVTALVLLTGCRRHTTVSRASASNF